MELELKFFISGKIAATLVEDDVDFDLAREMMKLAGEFASKPPRANVVGFTKPLQPIEQVGEQIELSRDD